MTHAVNVAVGQATALLSDLADERPVHRRRDLLAFGISDATQSALFRRRALTRLRHGVYALSAMVDGASVVDRHRLDVAAAIAAAREPCWAFGTSSAVLHGLPLPYDAPEQIRLVRGSGLDERALRRPSRHPLVIRDATVTTGPVDAAAEMVVRGVPTVGLALTAVSGAVELASHRWRVAMFDAVMWRGVSTGELEDTVDAWRHLGHRRDLMRALRLSRAGAQSVLETFSRLALVEDGLPEPVLQAAFHDARGLIGYADMWWPDLGVVGEADGAVKYDSRDDLVREKVREDRLRGLGLAVVRWTWQEIVDDAGAVAARVRRAARAAA